MSILKKLSSHQQVIDFHIKVHKLSSPFSTPVSVKVSWKRRKIQVGKKTTETSFKAKTSEIIEIDEILTMVNTIYQKTTGFLPKLAELKVIQSQGSKELGKVILNLSDFIEKPANQLEFQLENCPNAFLILSISTHISSLSQKPDKEVTVEALNKQLADSQEKLKNLQQNFEFVLNEKEKILQDLEKLKSELSVIQQREMIGNHFTVIDENEFLKKTILELKNELNELNDHEKNMKVSCEMFEKDLKNFENVKFVERKSSTVLNEVILKLFSDD